MITTQDNSVNSINAALLRAGKSKQEINVNNVQNVTNVSKTNEVVKLSDGTTIDIKTLRETNKYLVSEIEALAKKVVDYGTQITTLQDQIQNIKITSSDGGKTLIFSNYLDLDSETNIPTVTAQYSSNGLEWHDNFIANQDIYIHFSYDAGGSWTDPIKIVGEDGSAYAYYGLAYNGGEMPADAEGNFFLCGADFTAAAQLLVNGDALILNEDTYLTVNTLYKKGFIYVYTNYKWTRIDDKDNFRYIIAINDLIKIGEPVSPGLLKQFENSVNLYTPHYLGAYTEPPASPVKGDTFCYIGETTTMYTKNMCYKYEVREDFEGWSLLDPSAAKSKECYMSALSDILTDADTYGSFANLFVGNIFASNIATNRLEVFEQSAVSTAAADATSKANTAQANAINTASADATSKANAAKTDAISTASADATSKANQAKADAISTASADATSKANTAEQNAIDTAAQDAADKAELARLGAVSDIEELTGLDGLQNKTIIQGGKIRTDLIQASAIVIGTDQVTGLDTTLAGKASTQSVTDLSNVVDTKASAQSVSDLGAVVSDKADSSTVDALSTTVDGKADSSTVSALATTVSEKADSSTVTALETTVSGKADTSTVNALSQTVDTKTTLDAVRTDIGTSSLIDKTIIVGGYLRTGVIGANSITADKINGTDLILKGNAEIQENCKVYGQLDSGGIVTDKITEDIVQFEYPAGTVPEIELFRRIYSISIKKFPGNGFMNKELLATDLLPNYVIKSNGIVVSRILMSYYNNRATNIEIKLYDSNDNLIDYGEISGSVAVETIPLTYDLVAYYSLNNKNLLKIKNTPTRPIGIDDAVFIQEGLIQTQSSNPLIKLHFDAGTDYSEVYSKICMWLKPSTYTSCLGNYGLSDSSHNRAISNIKYLNDTLRLANVNETEYLTISPSTEGTTDRELNLLFIANN